MRFRMRLFLAALLSLHGYFLCRQFLWSSKIFAHTLLLSPEKRRWLTMPGLYQETQRLNHVVPPEAVLWFVSPEMPTDIGYFIFPRMLRWASPSIADRESIRRRHPNDWILTNHSSDARDDVFELLPPIVPYHS